MERGGLRKDKADKDCLYRLLMSGYQDSNLGPPAPKAGALTGLRYTPFFSNAMQRYDLFWNIQIFIGKTFKRIYFFPLVKRFCYVPLCRF